MSSPSFQDVPTPTSSSEKPSDGQPLGTSKSMIIASESSSNGSETALFPVPLHTAISEHSCVKGTPKQIREWLTSLSAETLAKTTPQQPRQEAQQIRSGRSSSKRSESFNPDTSFARIHQLCENWPRGRRSVFLPSLKAWVTRRRLPRSRRAVLVVTRDENGCSCSDLLPTVTKSQVWKPIRPYAPSEANNNHGKMLIAFLGHRNPNFVGCYLSPTYLERLAKWPIGWTDLRPLATESLEEWRSWLRGFLGEK